MAVLLNVPPLLKEIILVNDSKLVKPSYTQKSQCRLASSVADNGYHPNGRTPVQKCEAYWCFFLRATEEPKEPCSGPTDEWNLVRCPKAPGRKRSWHGRGSWCSRRHSLRQGMADTHLAALSIQGYQGDRETHLLPAPVLFTTVLSPAERCGAEWVPWVPPVEREHTDQWHPTTLLTSGGDDHWDGHQEEFTSLWCPFQMGDGTRDGEGGGARSASHSVFTLQIPEISTL